jgi:hypothetical protein
MPDAARLPRELHRDFHRSCELLIRTHYFEEANWLWTASAAPALCASPRAREVLRNASVVVRELGFLEVAKWVEDQVLRVHAT